MQQQDKTLKHVESEEDDAGDDSEFVSALPVIEEEDASRKADSVEDYADDDSEAKEPFSVGKDNSNLDSKMEQRQMLVAPAAGTGDLTP